MRRAVLPLLLAALLLSASQPAVAAPTIGGLIEGRGTAASFTIFAQGSYAIEGGAFEWTLVCGQCLARFAITTPGFTVIQNGEVKDLAPGLYELREYQGLIAHSETDGGRFVVLLGMGKVAQIPSN